MRPILFGVGLALLTCAPPAGSGTGGGSGTTGGGASSGGGSATGGGSAPTGGGSAATGGGSTSTGGGSAATGGGAPSEPLSPFIVVDQFGYRPTAEKVAVIRNPITGFDNGTHFTPGGAYALVDAASGTVVKQGAPTQWNSGNTDNSSGDKAWWFDFTSVNTPGTYYVRDETNHVRSAVFRIADDVYLPVLVQAVRMLYYQRDGTSKPAQYAGAEWADATAHTTTCTLYSNQSAPKDLHGGWFDAGDQNEYTNWAASYVIELLRAYTEHPAAFGDDTNIPESGNGVADLLDEVKWELDWLERMQDGATGGGVLSIVGHEGGSPPSSDNHACEYGPATTSASLTTAAAFAYASKVLANAPGFATAYPGYAADLSSRAQNAWAWAGSNPGVTFYNTGNVAAGEQEVDDNGRVMKKLQAAVFLYELTGTQTYRDFFDANYQQATLISSTFTDPSYLELQDTLLEYTRAANATANVANNIKNIFKNAVAGNDHLGGYLNARDPYRAYINGYYWGSNQVKAMEGNLYQDVIGFSIDPTKNADAARGSEQFVHSVHGVNPLQLVYLTRMEAFGSTKSITRMYHTWFGHGTQWDALGVSQFGPPPGYLSGGPNPGYAWDGCCPNNCGQGNSCGAAQLSPPVGQPDQKSYLDFNDSWPLNSWSVTEPSVGYQTHYIRLLSKFVN